MNSSTPTPAAMALADSILSLISDDLQPRDGCTTKGLCSKIARLIDAATGLLELEAFVLKVSELRQVGGSPSSVIIRGDEVFDGDSSRVLSIAELADEASKLLSPTAKPE